jgi:ribosomal protein S11
MFFIDFSLKKKYLLSKETNKSIFKLKNLLNEKQNYKNLNSLIFKRSSNDKKKLNGLIVVYIIFISFSSTNSFLHITDTLGNLKFTYSAGLVNFKGKQKKSRFLVLNSFFRELKKLKISTLKNKPISLHLNNVGFYKHFIIKNLKKNFFVRFVKSYETYPYNGCRKRKKLRKR